MNFSSKAADLSKAFCATAILLFSVNACTEVNDELGGDLLPNNQKMTIRVNTLDGVKMFTQKQDTLRGSGLGEVFFGKEYNPIFGQRTNSFIVQFLPTSLPYTEGYGLRPIVDSLVITLPLNSVHGKHDVEQEFEVYEVTWNNDRSIKPDSLSVDSVYYTFFPAGDYKGKKLFTFTHNGKSGLSTQLKPFGEDGRNYLNSIVNLDMETYKDDKLFRDKYKGLYITPAAGSPKDAATYGVSLDYETAYMRIYARNHDTLDISAIYDTVSAFFSFYDQKTDGVHFGNVSINKVDFDYTGTPVQDALDKTNIDKEAQKVTYIQPMGGVMTRLEFTDELVETLRNLRDDVDSDGNPAWYPGIMINQAEMHLYLKDDSTYEELDKSMKRVGSYLNANSLSSTPDYLYYSEWVQRNSTNGNPDYVLPYNGYLNRSNGYYKMDITSYVQQLAKQVAEGEESAIAQTVYLAPAAYSFFKFGESVVQNGDDPEKQIEIRITYTLIDGKDD